MVPNEVTADKMGSHDRPQGIVGYSQLLTVFSYLTDLARMLMSCCLYKRANEWSHKHDLLISFVVTATKSFTHDILQACVNSGIPSKKL